jgi:hypothetical protein
VAREVGYERGGLQPGVPPRDGHDAGRLPQGGRHGSIRVYGVTRLQRLDGPRTWPAFWLRIRAGELILRRYGYLLDLQDGAGNWSCNR